MTIASTPRVHLRAERLQSNLGDRVPAAEPRTRERKTYGSRLPLSGQGPVGETAYERQRAAKRTLNEHNGR